MSTPSAIAEIKLSTEERKRIARDLGISDADLSSVPERLHLHKYEVGESDDVSGYSLNFSSVTPSLNFTLPVIANQNINRFLLVAV